MNTLVIILLVINTIVGAILTGVVLMQKSEGGALGMGGGPSGFMTARGAGDLLTRITWILFAIFLAISIALTLISARTAGQSGFGKGLVIDPGKALEQPAPDGAAPPTTAPPSTAPAPDVTLPGVPPTSGLTAPPATVGPAPAEKAPTEEKK